IVCSKNGSCEYWAAAVDISTVATSPAMMRCNRTRTFLETLSTAIGHHSRHGRVGASAHGDVLDDAQALGVDHRDAVRQPVCGVDLVTVRCDGYAPRTPTHLFANRLDNRVVSSIDDVDGA